MWTFRPGYLGVTIAVIALLGGVLLGSLLNVSSHNETTTKYDYVSDISGLFDVSNEPQYIDFNPATNYTGYQNASSSSLLTDPTGLYYTPGQANNYRIPIHGAETTAGPSGTVNNDTNLPQVDTGGKTPASNRLATAEYIHSNPFQSFLSGFKVATVYDWAVATFGDLNNYSAIDLTVTIGNYTHPSTRGSFCSRFTMETNTTIDYNFNGSPGTNSYELNIQDLTITYYLGDTPYQASMYETYVCYGNANQIESYLDLDGGAHWEYSSDSTTLSFSYTSYVTTVPTYDYLIPSSGVSTSTASTTTVWDNDISTMNYDNRAVDILVGPTFDNGGWVYPVNGGGGLEIGLYNSAGAFLGGQQFSLNYFHTATDYRLKGWYLVQNPGAGGQVWNYLGDFKALSVHLENTGDELSITAYGVISFTTYLLATVSPVASFSYTTDGGANGPADLDKIRFYSPGRLSWLITNTNVFMDTYGAVLVDPSINLANYWPDMNSYRYAFQSFALYGDSITINGVTYPVVDQTITINNKAYVLDNFYLSFSEQGETSITFNNINKTVSLGETTDKTVSFSGYWGFTTGLYEGKTDFKKVYDWSIKLLGDNLNTIVLIALGLVAVLMLACKWLGMPFRMTDKIVLAGAGLFMVLLLVV